MLNYIQALLYCKDGACIFLNITQMRIQLLLLISLFSLSLSAQVERPVTLPVWPEGAPESNGYTNDDPKSTKERAVKVAKAELLVYPAQNPNGMAIICCPGGGYAHLAMAHEGYDMADWMNAQGITFAVLKYRMPNGHKNIPLSDAEQAIQIIKQHAKEWNVDTQKIGIMGSSAGGHLAATTANMAAERPAFQILLYPVISMGDDTHKGSRERLLGKEPSESDIQAYSMELQVNKETPRAFIALSGDDRTVPPSNSLKYAQALIREKIPVSIHIYPIGGHGWGFRDSFPYKRQWTEELEKWLRELNK